MSVERLEERSTHKPVIKEPKGKSIFSRLSKVPSVASALNSQDNYRWDQRMGSHDINVSTKKRTCDYSPEHGDLGYQDGPRMSVERLAEMPTHKPVVKKPKRQSVFNRLSEAPALKSQDNYRRDQRMGSHDSNVSTKKRSHEYSPEHGDLGYQDRPRKLHIDLHDRKDNLHAPSHKRGHYHDYDNPDNYGPPEVTFPRHTDYDNPESNERPPAARPSYIDYDNPEYQERPPPTAMRPSYINRNHRERKVDHRGSKMRGNNEGRQRRPHRPTAEELDAELEEMVNPTIDTDVFGH